VFQLPGHVLNVLGSSIGSSHRLEGQGAAQGLAKMTLKIDEAS